MGEEVADMNWGQFKGRLTEAMVAELQPVRTAHDRLLGDRAHLDAVLAAGADKAAAVAEATLAEAKAAMGLLPPHRNNESGLG